MVIFVCVCTDESVEWEYFDARSVARLGMGTKSVYYQSVELEFFDLMALGESEESVARLFGIGEPGLVMWVVGMIVRCDRGARGRQLSPS